MNPGAAHLSNWQRILFGDAPPIFLLEVVFRTLIMYGALLLTLRFLGKRMNAQISITELAVMISVGGIVSLPMQSPDRGLLGGFVLLFTIFLLQKGFGLLSLKSGFVEAAVYGRMETLLKYGVLETNVLRQEGITKDQLFAALRGQGVTNLGELDRVYMEAYGMFSVFRSRSPRPGLSTLPEKDRPFLASQVQHGILVCGSCGTACKDSEDLGACPNCHGHQWTNAVL